MHDYYSYWIVDAIGKSAWKLKGPGKLNNPNGSLKQSVKDFYGERVIEFYNSEGSEKEALEKYYNI